MLRRKFLLAISKVAHGLSVVEAILFRRRIDPGSGSAKDISVVKMENVRRTFSTGSAPTKTVHVDSTPKTTVESDPHTANARVVTAESTVNVFRFSGLVGYGIGRLHVIRKFVVNATRNLTRAASALVSVRRKIFVARSVKVTSGTAIGMLMDSVETVARLQNVSAADGVNAMVDKSIAQIVTGNPGIANGVSITVEGRIQTRSTADLVCWAYPVLTDGTLYIPASQSVSQVGNRLIIT